MSCVTPNTVHNDSLLSAPTGPHSSRPDCLEGVCLQLVGWLSPGTKQVNNTRVRWAGLLCSAQNSFLSFLFLSLFLFCFHAIDVSERPNSTGWRSSANIFRKGPESKHFRLQGPQSRRHNYSTLRLQCKSMHRQCGNRGARLCSNKTLFK